MPIYEKQDINPEFKYRNLGKFLNLIIRIADRKERLKTRQTIIVLEEGIHEYKMNTNNFFKDKKE